MRRNKRGKRFRQVDISNGVERRDVQDRRCLDNLRASTEDLSSLVQFQAAVATRRFCNVIGRQSAYLIKVSNDVATKTE